jgi:predicted dehydrogenase
MGDIGVHAFHLAEFVTNLRTTELCADLNSIVASRELDDDGAAFLRFDNDLRLRVYGDAAGLDWRQQEPSSLWLKHAHKPTSRHSVLAQLQELAQPLQPPSRQSHVRDFLHRFGACFREARVDMQAGTTYAVS